ncbi:tail completion protein gp17 [Kushneria phosphatilytica]|uniref:DUF3168 domain-containing protein n=1 Tax=Kushneria phosphatilytica TaxID=657387 RepID=A0A1S1NZB9_9GAMM|nr:DUF3168 domain-containing protein [Kushneria phosphatilytica]OHV13011.1 hypothetical protein BH688_03135 [Kushneria phosphatilytica]QEL10882.1 DUF3168 domain-containing protein [Kushneria phosphatilytica]
MIPPIFRTVAGNAAATALIGTGPVRMFPFGQAPQGVELPYAVWQVVDGEPENYLADRSDMDGMTLQVDVYGSSGSSADDAAEAIRYAVELRANIARWGGQTRDDETGRYRVSFDIDWLTPR